MKHLMSFIGTSLLNNMEVIIHILIFEKTCFPFKKVLPF